MSMTSEIYDGTKSLHYEYVHYYRQKIVSNTELKIPQLARMSQGLSLYLCPVSNLQNFYSRQNIKVP